MKNNAAVLWTGGKDCALAFMKAQEAGYHITHLVTFAPENPDFKAHALSFIQQQVAAIGLPHLLLTVTPPLQESYEDAIQHLKDTYQIHTLVTGDIDEIDGHPNWMAKCSEKSGMQVYAPLWKKDREFLLNELLKHQFQVIFSLVKKPFFSQEWVGKNIDETVISVLKHKLNIDICGENGEYHTMVTNAPYFNNKIQLDRFRTEEHEHYYYLNTTL